MTGYLIVNGFLKGASYKCITDHFSSVCEKKGIELKVKGNNEFLVREDIKAVYYKNEETGKLADFADDLPDFVVFYDKDLFLARALEELGIPVFNSARAIEVCDSKAETFEALKGKVRMPKTVNVPFSYDNIKIDNFSFVQLIDEEFDYPVVVKENKSSLGMGVHIARNELEIVDIINNAASGGVTVQEYIDFRKGEDIRIFTVGDKISAAMRRKNSIDFRANAALGSEAFLYEPSSEEVKLALDVAKLLNLSFGGIDLLFSENGPVFIEANSNAHFGKLFDVTGIDVSNDIIDYILSVIK